MPHKFQTFIDISDAEWKIIQFRKDKDKAVLKRCDVINAAGRDAADMEREFRSVLSALARRGDTVVGLPRKKVLLKYMLLPSSDGKEITKMVGLQLVSRIPYAMQEVVYDHVVLRTDEAGYAHVQAVVVLISVIDEYLGWIKPLASSISRMSVSSYGIAAWFDVFAKKRAWPPQKVFLVLNIDQEYSEACFCQGPQLLFSRFIPSGHGDLSRRETAAILQQLQWSLDLYLKEHVGPEVNHILLVGALEDSDFLKQVMQEKFGMAVDAVHPFDVIDDKDRRMFELMKSGSGRSWTVCLGHMLNPSVQNLNVSPRSLRRDYASQKQTKHRMTAAFLAAAAIGLGILLVVLEISVRQSRLQDLQRQISDLQPQAERLNLVEEHTRALDDYFMARIRVSELMKELYKRTPDDVVYQSVYWTEDGEWVVQGYAQTRSGVNNLQSGMIDSAWFQDIQLDYATKRKMGNVDVTDFRIHCRVIDKTRGVR